MGDAALSMAESLDGPLLQRYKSLAQKYGVWLSLGGFQEKCEANPIKRYSKQSQR